MNGSPPVELKLNSSMLAFLFIRHSEIDKLKKLILHISRQLPENFIHSVPLVLDFSRCEQLDTAYVHAVLVLLKQLDIKPLGINQSSNLPEEIDSFPFKTKDKPKWSEAESTLAIEEAVTEKNTVPQTEAAPKNENILIRQPVRSGQQQYAKGDLTIIGNVSAGAEVIADGNIHIYGSLRGRAFAGAKGDEKTFIFCREFDAECVSIAGNYQIREQTEQHNKKKNVFIHMANDKMIYETL